MVSYRTQRRSNERNRLSNMEKKEAVAWIDSARRVDDFEATGRGGALGRVDKRVHLLTGIVLRAAMPRGGAFR